MKARRFTASNDGRLCRQHWNHLASCKSCLQDVKVPEMQRYFEALRLSLTPLYARRSIIEAAFSMHIIGEQEMDGGANTLSVPKFMAIKQRGQGPLRENAWTDYIIVGVCSSHWFELNTVPRKSLTENCSWIAGDA